MTLTAGMRLGPYEVLSSIGAGGMGEVYSGRDTRLRREVAIKVISSAFAGDPERLRRFEQEARATAALNHPNVVAVYDVGTQDGVTYVVTELLKGRTLRQRLAGAALSGRATVDYAVQIAHGLAAAHANGLVHRDLKPENLFITNDGRIKILDFGLAKLSRLSSLGASTTAAISSPDTQPGLILGTMGYMSPEQVRGHEVDHRSDIFSFGAILYEMVSGQRAFQGDNTADTMAAILARDPPDLSVSSDAIVSRLAAVIRRCLEKVPAQRFQSAQDLAFVLEASGSSGSGLATVPSANPGYLARLRRKHLILAACALTLLVGGIMAGQMLSRLGQAEPSSSITFSIVAPEAFTTYGSRFAISPDGRRVVFTAQNASLDAMLFLRELDQFVAHPLFGTHGASQPFWAPNGSSIGFFAHGKLKRLDLGASSAQNIADVHGTSRGAAWSSDGTIVFGVGQGGLSRVPAGGGPVQPLTRLDTSRGDVSHGWPQFLPGQPRFLFYVRTSVSTSSGIFTGRLDSPDAALILHNESPAQLAGSNYLLFARNQTLLAQRFDGDSMQLQGDPRPIIAQVNAAPDAPPPFAASEEGVLVYASTNSTVAQLEWRDRNGRVLRTVGPPGALNDLALSPDQSRLAFTQWGPDSGSTDLWLLDLKREAPSRVTFDPGAEWVACWSPDGRDLVYSRENDLYQISLVNQNKPQLLFSSPERKWATDFSPNGRFIVFQRLQHGLWDVWALQRGSGTETPFPVAAGPLNQMHGKISPDSRWVAYTSDETGRREIYIQEFATGSAKVRVSTEGGAFPRWRADQKELFYIAADGHLMAAQLRAAPNGFEIDGVSRLFLTQFPSRSGAGTDYEVSTDGRRFLVTSPAAKVPPPSLRVIVNWPALLTHRR